MKATIGSGQGSESAWSLRWIVFSAALVIAFAALLYPTALHATYGDPNEITNIHVENVTQTTVDVVWDTIHPSTSQVIIARDMNYEPERWAPEVPDPNLVNHHRVTVDKLVPYYSVTGDGVYYYYVASVDVSNNIYTNPGPNDPTGTTAVTFLSFKTLPTYTAGATDYSFYTYGGANVFAGSDLYLQVVNILKSGPIGHLYVVYNGTKDQNHDGIVRDSNNNVVNSIQVHYTCQMYDAKGDNSADQIVSSPYNYCYGSPSLGANNDVLRHNIRVRTSPSTPPGVYTVSVTLTPDTAKVYAYTYSTTITVLPAPSFTATPPSSFPPIPNKSTWETQMTTLGGYWCDGKNGNSRDSQNAAGNFLLGFGWYADAWNYDGGRVYQQIDTYTTNNGAANHPRWQHCALAILDPYRQYILNNNAALQAPSIFPYGMMMNYWRTADASNNSAVNLLATADPFWPYGGWVDPYWMRETAYQIDVWIAAEMAGHARYPLLNRAVDRLIGQLDQFSNQKFEMHPFMAGIAMEALINWYEMNLLENTPDQRIPAVIKMTLDALWRDWYLDDSYSLLYNRYSIPNQFAFTELNDLVAPAYAWYWSKTGDDTYLNEGDILFQHTFDNPGAYAWSGKQFTQIYKWSFDYVGWRSGATTSTIAKANNPYGGAYADTEPPIESKVAVQNITTSSANITWNTYEPADSQVYYGLTKSYTNSSQVIDQGQNRKTSHLITIKNLRTRTTYHFQVRSKDASGNLAASYDYTFTTK